MLMNVVESTSEKATVCAIKKIINENDLKLL